jgi:hypothetical protein
LQAWHRMVLVSNTRLDPLLTTCLARLCSHGVLDGEVYCSWGSVLMLCLQLAAAKTVVKVNDYLVAVDNVPGMKFVNC